MADGIYEIVEHSGGIGETYHLTAGVQASTIAEISQLASHYFSRPAPRVLTPDEFEAEANGSNDGTAIEGGRAYFPYFSIKAEFDDAVTRARLEPAGIKVSPLGDYMDRLLDFATRSRWGKRPIARVEALAS